MLLLSTEKINRISIISNNKRKNVFENSAIQCNVNNLKGRCTVPPSVAIFISFLHGSDRFVPGI